MYYSDLYFQQRKKPVLLLAGVALASLVGLLTFFMGGKNITSTRASKVKVMNYKVVNLSPEQAAVFWETEITNKNESEKINQINFGKDKLDKLAPDEKNALTGEKNDRYHYAVIRDLAENTKYYYRIVSDEGVFPDKTEKPLSFTTPPRKNVHSNLGVAYGKILQLNSDNPAVNAVVFFNFQGKYSPLVTMTKSDGSFVVPLNYLVDSNNEMVIPNEFEKVDIEIFDENGKTTVRALLNQTKNLPVLRIGDAPKDLTQENQVLAASVSKAPEQKQTETVLEQDDSVLSIIYPKKNAIIPGQKPLIKGTSLPNKEVLLTINSSPQYSFRTMSNSKGEWGVTPVKKIAAGDYELTVISEDQKGNKITKEQPFSIAKSGEQVLGEATAEPTLEPTTAPISAPTIEPTGDINQYITPTASPPTSGFNNSWLVIVSSLFMLLGFLVLRFF